MEGHHDEANEILYVAEMGGFANKINSFDFQKNANQSKAGPV